MAAAMNMAPRSPGLLAGPHETRSAAAVFQGHQHRPQPYPSKSGLCTNGLLDWGNEVSEADGPQKCRTVNALGWEMLVGGWEMAGGRKWLEWELRVGMGILGEVGSFWSGKRNGCTVRLLGWEMTGVRNGCGGRWLASKILVLCNCPPWRCSGKV